MPYIKIHQEKAQDKARLAALCPFRSIDLVNDTLSINAGCRMCRICIKKAGDVFEYVEEELPAAEKEKWRGIAVVAEITEGTIHPVTFELLGKARELAAKVNYPVYCLMIGSGIREKAGTILEYGADEVFVYDMPELRSFRIEPYTGGSGGVHPEGSSLLGAGRGDPPRDARLHRARRPASAPV